jgi:ceramide glucosyltransferase
VYDVTAGLSIDGALLALASLSALYWLGALASTATFPCRRRKGFGWTPPVSVLKPLLKDDGHLYDNLRTFCVQDYPAFEVLFGVQDESDPAVRVVNRLMRECAQRELRLIVQWTGDGRQSQDVQCRESLPGGQAWPVRPGRQ